jgi:hypothetical protein
MRKLLFILFTITFLLACKKAELTTIAPVLNGSWRMEEVHDNLTNTTTTKPVTLIGNVDITFAFNDYYTGNITGATPTNSLSGSYAVSQNRSINVTAVTITKVAETSWGQLFLDNINNAESFVFNSNGRLRINSTTNKVLIFVRL